MNTSTEKLLKAREFTRDYYTRCSLYRDGLLSWDGKSVTVTSAIFGAAFALAATVAVPECWPYLVPGALYCFFTAAIVQYPHSALFTINYALNWVYAALNAIGNVLTLAAVLFVPDEMIFSYLASVPGYAYDAEKIAAVLPNIRLALLIGILVSTFMSYVAIGALRHVKREAEAKLPK